MVFRAKRGSDGELVMKLKLTGRTVGNLMVGTCFGALLLSSSASLAGNVGLIPQGSVWKYEATGANLGSAWREPAYNDTGWPSGAGELGYGDGDEATVITSSPVRYTYYFRRNFQIADRSLFTALALRLIKDDGCVVYLNGQEVVRYNMPTGTITSLTPASTASEFGWESTLAIPPSLLVNGNNVMAVEVHQANLTSTDVSFDLELVGTKPNITLNLDSPADGASELATPVTLQATASSSASEQLTVNFYGRPVVAAIPEFSIVVLPDTQFYTSEFPGNMSMFQSQIGWILANRSASNIVFVAHEGDITDDGDIYENQWYNATNAMYRLDAPSADLPYGIPYSVAVGNHDQLVPSGDTSPTTYYNKYFGVNHFSGRSYYGGNYGGNNNNSYQFFSASGMDFIVLTLEYTPSAAVLSWANGLLQQHANRRAILLTHSLLETTAAWTTPGLAIYNALKGNANLFLMLCGHNHGEARRTDVYNGNTIETVLADYQTYPGGGNGLMRILTFSPSNNEIRFQTYSPYLSQYEVGDSSEFTLNYPMGANFTLITQNSGVTSGTQTTATWTGLQAGAGYEWFVTANDGLETLSSAVRTFTTSFNNNSAPTVVLTEPAANTSYPDMLSATVTLTATASDLDGTVSQVEFFANGASLGSTATVPHTKEHTFGPGIYSITAVATDNLGATSTSTPVTLTVDATPTAPSNLSVVAGSVTCSSVDLMWMDNSLVEQHYDVLVSLDGTSYVLGATAPTNSTVASVQNLAPNTPYHFKVVAVNSYGTSSSGVVQTTTSLPPPPLAPTIGAAEVLSSSMIRVTWTDTSTDETSFAVLISTDGTGFTLLGTLPANSIETTATGLSPLTTYYFRVQAVNAGGFRESATVNATTPAAPAPPAAPTGLTAVPFSNTEIQLTWTDNSTDETGFRIERSLDEVAWSTVQTVAPGATTFTNINLTSGTVYYYRVFAVKGETDSAPTDSAAAAPFIDSYAANETLVLGTLAGSRANTFEDDSIYEQLTEQLTGSKNTRTSGLEHKWIFDVPTGGSSVFYVKGYRGSSPDGDEFVFAYSLDNANFTDMVTVTATTPDSDYLSYALPSGVQGTVHIRVRDSNRTAGANALDSVHVDHLLIRTDLSSLPPPPPATTSPPTNLVATGSRKKITLNWTQSTSVGLTGNIIYRSINGTDFAPLITISPTTTYIDVVPTGSIFSYRVTAVSSTTPESVPSNTASATAR